MAEMEPWERHAAGAGMKRFSYASAASLQQKSHGGFLVTCPFRREKSATKEIMDLLAQYIESCSLFDGETVESSIASEQAGSEPQNLVTEASKQAFALIKLSRSGIVFLSTLSPVDTVGITVRVLRDLSTGTRKPPSWCHRLVPVQATCLVEKDAIYTTVLKLLKEDASGILSQCKTTGLKYAVNFTKRDGDDMKISLGRMDCIELAAKAIREVEEHASVDLSNPEIVVAVEVLPVVGLKDAAVCGVALLPKDIIVAKPKMSIRALSSVAGAKT